MDKAGVGEGGTSGDMVLMQERLLQLVVLHGLHWQEVSMRGFLDGLGLDKGGLVLGGGLDAGEGSGSDGMIRWMLES